MIEKPIRDRPKQTLQTLQTLHAAES